MRTLLPDQLSRAVIIAAIAGAVDVIAFLSVGGFFVSFMSGNSTRLAIGVNANWYDALFAFELIAGFVAGVTATALLRRKRPERATALGLTALTALLCAAALLAAPGKEAPMLLLSLAMGSVNTLFEQDGNVRLGLTYMTGALVRLGQGLADWMSGHGSVSEWSRFLLLWLGFVGGGMGGVGLYARFGTQALWAPALLAALLMALEWARLRAAATSPAIAESAPPLMVPDPSE